MLEASRELRPLVGLSGTPSLDVSDRTVIAAGEGSDRVLSEWLNWQQGREYFVDDKTVKSLSNKAKL